MKYIALILVLSMASCSMPKFPDYDIVQNELYDIPAKTQVIQRIVFKDSVSNNDLKIILNANFKDLMNRSYQHHIRPTHIFIYAYDSKVDYKKDGGNWIAMISRVMNEDKGIEIKK